jgi:hypothetical protein
VGTHPFGSELVRQFDGMIVEPPIYSPAMLTDRRWQDCCLGDEESGRGAGLPEKLVLNCTGLGAKSAVWG